MRQLVFSGMGMTLAEKIDKSIRTLQLFAPPDCEKYWLGFSGGKDSIVLLAMAKRAGVQYEAHYSVTTVDPPEILWHMRKYYPEVRWDRPSKPMWAMIAEKGMPPTRIARWCCAEYKESKAPDGSRVLLGIRAEESPRRAARWKTVQVVRRYGRTHTIIAPLLTWTEQDVWDYIRGNGLPYPELYNEGRKRLGCVMCPMARGKKKDAARWPRIARLWRKGIFAAWERRALKGLTDTSGKWKTPEAMYEWWLGDGDKDRRTDECQGLGLFVDGD